MAYQSKDAYPRPDFVHTNHRWAPINDQWTVLFDDKDVGLKELWHINGVPDKVSVTTVSASSSADAEAEAQRLAAFPELIAKGFEARKEKIRENTKKPINVPFTFQTPASGLYEKDAHEVLWYERPVSDPRAKAEVDAGDRVLARFGAVDYSVTLWLSGYLVGKHRGGHVPFDVDITDVLDIVRQRTGESELQLVLRVVDSPYDLGQPRGKQYWAPQPESIFYTPSSGIWQPVVLEVVPATRLGNSSAGTVLKSNDIHGGVLDAEVAVVGRRAGHAYSVEIEGSLQGYSIGKKRESLPKDKDFTYVKLPLVLSEDQKRRAPPSLTSVASYDNPDFWYKGKLAVWSPDYPTLYDLVIRLYDSEGKVIDEVKTYTGFRHLDWNKGDGTFRLNDKPLFQALCLDQGYWPETGLTPPSQESLKEDIVLAKKMGFNGCRKHQKVEDPVFLYWADKLGYLVWGEMANAYEFSAEYKDRMNQEWAEAVKRDINHPSVITWTPVNESWGYPSLKDNIEQRNHVRSLYYLTKTLDPTRPVNDNCGWEHVLTDLSTFHDYSDAPALSESCATLEKTLDRAWAGRPMFLGPIGEVDPGTKHRPGAPVICTEFAGVNIAPTGAKSGEIQPQGGGGDWGYTTASDASDLLTRIDALVKAVCQGSHVTGFVYTQLSDIEQEVNGVYSFDRKEKIPAAEVKRIFDTAKKSYLDSLPRET
ncbi:glycoside hydrolase family 2 protein [Xylaria bambusicola]|uniref:glycoside hydrolase family 2 protein n=1 Tax=Xylaria bambusicola TaxID=326684 RepID=UPI002007FF64|nr:glycoside hydrolase family 2 protein [Xylaria bambusicola]KAI0523723.1 glycoside hydrolase family 2 protein [Xylaria bambusicola]